MAKHQSSVNHQVGFDLDIAFRFGREDAHRGMSHYAGLEYYPLGSLTLNAYNEGHAAGVSDLQEEIKAFEAVRNGQAA